MRAPTKVLRTQKEAKTHHHQVLYHDLQKPQQKGIKRVLPKTKILRERLNDGRKGGAESVGEERY